MANHKIKTTYFAANTLSEIITLLNIEGADTTNIYYGVLKIILEKNEFPVILGRFSEQNQRDGYLVRKCDEKTQKILEDGGMEYSQFLIKIVKNARNEEQLVDELMRKA